MKSTTMHPMEVAKRVGGGGDTSASNVSFDNSLTELVAENVQQAIEEVADESHITLGALTVNDSLVYMDYHDGKYGINTSEGREEESFIPFRSGSSGGLSVGEPIVVAGETSVSLDMNKYYFFADSRSVYERSAYFNVLVADDTGRGAIVTSKTGSFYNERFVEMRLHELIF